MDVVVIGAGFGGLTAAAALVRAGFGVRVLERADRLGGVWRDNTYPGAACDVPSQLYSWSWAPNSAWPRRYSGQADILAYLERTAAEHGLDRLVRFGADVVGAAFRDGRWHVELAGGEVVTADVLVPAVGQLSRPSVPDIAGVERFAGPVFHSAEWDHDVDLRGKRVAVVGTGASAVQFVPRIQPLVAHLDLYQRTPPWVVPKPDRAYTAAHHWLFRHLPPVRAAGRAGVWLGGEALTAAFTSARPLAKAVEALARAHLRWRVPDPALRAALTPDYPVGCKRLLFSNDYLPALAKPGVDVVTEKITEVTGRGVVTGDGVERPADVLIWGTGFQATDFLAPLRITGPDGTDLRSRAWAGGARAHLGLTVPGFPNLFLVYGPNTNLGGNSIIFMLEQQARYLTRVLTGMRERGAATAEVRREVADRFDREVQGRLRHSAWVACDSWYREDDGRISTNWPGLVAEYRRRTRHPDLDEFTLAPRPAATPT
ncbi:flavin-containing monooxygenase [Actinokineospora bangkokensis]|uniref:4-hydroxyacetophenone monooxygenase n=1 Tax=Actinokineospora bangkokensis TaxID=1193682 RepID=A0A1Q9LJ51_9PSEU|nr:NAD(P)/FAD-dependent oxidoreductase [Actinokineospora bangkokensis]OLR92077.1 4-hydroxyacetophenone monooxygenase [Actinokineospora bangkokensis]